MTRRTVTPAVLLAFVLGTPLVVQEVSEVVPAKTREPGRLRILFTGGRGGHLEAGGAIGAVARC
jgi:hypothetical protein